MKRVPSHVTVAERIEDLPVINDIDEMLLEGVSSGDVAKFIKLGLEELLDVKESTLNTELKRRRSRLREQPQPQVVDENERLAAVVPPGRRKPALLSRSKYVRISKAMDRMIELEALYLAQRDRLDYLIEKEIDLGFPFEMTGREFLVAAKFLELHGKEERELLKLTNDGPAHEKLDIRGYSEETARTLRKPDSRRRVVSIVERLKRVKGGVDIPELPEAAAHNE
jgi:hypothetical protein